MNDLEFKIKKAMLLERARKNSLQEPTEMTDDPTKLQLIYLSQIPMVLASIDDSLKSIRQTLSNMTGVMKEGQNDQDNRTR